MKLKASIEEKVVKARKMVKGKPEAEAAYYEGVVYALEWVLGSRKDNGGIMGYKLEIDI